MKKYLVRFVSLVLVLVVAAGMIIPAYAVDYTCSSYEECTEGGAEVYIITKDNCPIRTEPNGDAKVAARGKTGQLISVSDVFRTKRFTKWAKINVIGSNDVLYCHIDNIERHSKHAFVRILDTNKGYLDFCSVCGYSTAKSDKEVQSCNLACVADQALWGNLSDYNPSFWGVVAQIIVGEIPGVNVLTDARDLIGDILNGENLGVVLLDAAALLPLVGALKYADELSFITKNADEFHDAAKKTEYLPWATWKEYPKVKRDGQEFVKLGDFYYSHHAVDEFTPAFVKSNKINGLEHSRGLSPTYVNWILTDGVAEGVTIVSDARDGCKSYTNGIFEIIVDKDKIVTIRRNSSKK